MKIDELVVQATAIEAKIAAVSGDERFELHQKLHRCLEQIKVRGGRVPAHLRNLDLELIDEEVEDSFDNMPV